MCLQRKGQKKLLRGFKGGLEDMVVGGKGAFTASLMVHCRRLPHRSPSGLFTLSPSLTPPLGRVRPQWLK